MGQTLGTLGQLTVWIKFFTIWIQVVALTTLLHDLWKDSWRDRAEKSALGHGDPHTSTGPQREQLAWKGAAYTLHSTPSVSGSSPAHSGVVIMHSHAPPHLRRAAITGPWAAMVCAHSHQAVNTVMWMHPWAFMALVKGRHAVTMGAFSPGEQAKISMRCVPDATITCSLIIRVSLSSCVKNKG